MSARLATLACRFAERRMRALLAFELASSGGAQAALVPPSPGEAASSTNSSSDGAATLSEPVSVKAGPERSPATPENPLALAGDRGFFMEEN